MKKVRLRIVSLFIAVTMLLAMMPSTAMAAGEVVKTGQVQNSTISTSSPGMTMGRTP